MYIDLIHVDHDKNLTNDKRNVDSQTRLLD